MHPNNASQLHLFFLDDQKKDALVVLASFFFHVSLCYYEIPPAYLEDEQFARLIEEAEKYVGFPYVWGGSSPETSFDCSGFVSYVLTNSGLYNTGRLGAQGLYNISTRVSNPQPGDLVFFTGTYDTPGVSHVGIYVGPELWPLLR